MTDEEIVAALAEVVATALDAAYHSSSYRWPQQEDCPRTAAALLPTVRHIAEQRAAEELRSAADWLWDDDPATRSACDHLQDRADDLHPMPVVFEPIDRPSSLRGRAVLPRAAALTATPEHGRSAT